MRANGTTANPGLQVGLQPGFGSNVHVQGGKRLLALSSGYARTPAQQGACGSLSCTSSGPGTPRPRGGWARSRWSAASLDPVVTPVLSPTSCPDPPARVRRA